jgi:hypothetical protein
MLSLFIDYYPKKLDFGLFILLSLSERVTWTDCQRNLTTPQKNLNPEFPKTRAVVF